MDEEIARWILEFLLRQPIEDRIVNTLLSILPVSDTDTRLKKTLLLKRIESESSTGSVSEKILDSLEIIEELNHREGKTTSDSMKSAYCAVAVDCTVRFLDENAEKNLKYLDAVKRIWRGRVSAMEKNGGDGGLNSEKLRKWRGEIEVAVRDSSVCERILMMNTRNEALKAIRVYLGEAWREMGPTFLELVAARTGKGKEGEERETACEDAVEDVQKPLKCKHMAIHHRRTRAAAASSRDSKFCDNDKNDEVRIKKKYDNIPTPEVKKLLEALKSSSNELRAVVKDPLPDQLRIAKTVSSELVRESVKDEPLSEKRSTESSAENAQSEDGGRNRSFVKNTTENSMQKDDDREYIRKENGGKKDITREDDSRNESHCQRNLEKDTTREYDSRNENHCQRNPEKDTTQEDLSRNENHCQRNPEKNTTREDDSRNQNHYQRNPENLPVRSLMERNSTACRYEWDDSIDDSFDDRPHLSSPCTRKMTPLSKIEFQKLAMRRKKRRWTPEEEAALRAGVDQFGKGNWKLILNCYHDEFQGRTDVDLKDKWRNLTKIPRLR